MTSNRKRIRETFEDVSKYWPLMRFATMQALWKEAVEDDQQHQACSVAYHQCKGCQRQICTHLVYARYSTDPTTPVCAFCDEYCQPYLANPLNKRHCKKYLKPEQYKLVWKE